MISIFGENLSTPPITANFDDKAFFPTSLGNSQVTFNGVLAPLLYVSNTQINAIVPYEVANANTVDIVVLRQIDKSSPLITVPSAAWTLPLVATVPGIFTTSQTGSGPGAILNVNATTGQTTPNSSANPAKRGSAITLFATGSGVWNPAQPTGQILIFPQGLTDNLTPSRSIPGIIPRLPVSLTIGGRPTTTVRRRCSRPRRHPPTQRNCPSGSRFRPPTD